MKLGYRKYTRDCSTKSFPTIKNGNETSCDGNFNLERQPLYVADSNKSGLTIKTDQMMTSSIRGKENVEMEGDTTRWRGNKVERLMEINLETTIKKMATEETDKRVKTEFQICAKTFDRVALLFFVCMFVIITVGYLVATT